MEKRMEKPYTIKTLSIKNEIVSAVEAEAKAQMRTFSGQVAYMLDDWLSAKNKESAK